jgi:hypothetical protein
MLRITVQVRGVGQQFDVRLPRDAATVGHLKAAIDAAHGFPLVAQTIAESGSPDATTPLPDAHDLAAGNAESITLALFVFGKSATPAQVGNVAARMAARLVVVAAESTARAATADEESGDFALTLARRAAAALVRDERRVGAAAPVLRVLLRQSTGGQLTVTQHALLPRHAFNRAPAALRIFRFAADTAPRVLELAHVSEMLRECAVEFGSADAALPGALRSEYASGRYFKLRAVVERNAARFPWLAAKLLSCRGGAPVPAAALAPDVTRHDVNWGAEGARRSVDPQLTHSGHGLSCVKLPGWRSAQGPIGVTSGKHFFQASVTALGFGRAGGEVKLGWVDDKLACSVLFDHVGWSNTLSAGAAYSTYGRFYFGTAPLTRTSYIAAAQNRRPCVIGCMLDVAVFVDGEPLAVQCDYDFPKDGRAWFPSVLLWEASSALHSCAM